jgi:hypothetical protein
MKQFFCVVGGLMLSSVSANQALASRVVGAGTPGSCTEAALDAALVGGGTVTFKCGGAATITVTSTKTISADTTIDGGSLITISGGNSVGVFSVNDGVNFTVQNLIIANGNSATSGGGILNDGTLTVTIARSAVSCRVLAAASWAPARSQSPTAPSPAIAR